MTKDGRRDEIEIARTAKVGRITSSQAPTKISAPTTKSQTEAATIYREALEKVQRSQPNNLPMQQELLNRLEQLGQQKGNE